VEESARHRLSACTGFEWDKGNVEKNWKKHRVTFWECEQVSFNEPLIVAADARHSEGENRFYALGRTDEKRFLFVVFTIRGSMIRVISARDMSLKERKEYGRHEKEDPTL